MVRTTEEIMNAMRTRFGEDTSDEALSLLEDLTDTFADMASHNSEDWKIKYEQNDANWRKKYHDRFFGSSSEPDPIPAEEPKKRLSFDDLFK